MSISRAVLAKYLTPETTFVETGTRWGDTCIRVAEIGCASIITCEMDTLMFGIAQAHLWDAMPRFGVPWSITHLPSTAMIPAKLSGREDVTFFLDAHGESQSPLLEELEEIGKLEGTRTTILIDDWRLVLSRAWGFGEDEVLRALMAIGPHSTRFEPGVEPNDILVARYET